MELLGSLLSGLGLSAGAGLNAYIPLLVVGILNRWTSLIDLAEPYSVLSDGWVLGVLTVLVAIEVVADNLPAVNHVNDVIQTLVRPAAGAVVFAASTEVASVHPVLAVIAGLIVAGSVHATKATVVRPAVTAATAGMGNTPVSVTEDVVSAGLSVLAIVIPIVVGLVIASVVAALALWWFRRRKRSVSSSR